MKLLAILLAQVALLAMPGCDRHEPLSDVKDISDTRLALEIAVANADRIAVVRIVSRRVLGLGTHGCGAIMSAEVIEALKGDTSPFAFFLHTGVRHDFGTDRYLVFAYRTEVPSAETEYFLSSHATADEESVIKCRLQAEYYVPRFSETFWPFNPDVSERLGGQWIGPPSQSSVIWCWKADAAPGDPPFESERFRYYDPGDWESPEYAISWETAKELIERALRNWPYAGEGDARFSDPVRSDFVYGGC